MLLLSLLVVPALFRLSAAEERFQCPLDDIKRTQCMGPRDCIYPHPTNCRKYIICNVNDDGVTGRPTIKDCPPRLVWNNNTKECDFAENSTCNTAIDRVVSEVSKILPRGDGVEIKIRDAAPFQCPISDMAITQCRSEKDCVYPNPGSCHTYIQCNLGSNFLPGAPAVKNCLPGHEWNDKDKKCDVPEKSTCPVYANAKTPVIDGVEVAEKKTRQAPRFHCPNRDIIRTKCLGPKDCLYPNPENCFSFIQCMVDPGERSGTPIVIPCRSGFEWNDNDKKCDKPENSTCPRETLGDAIGGTVSGLEKTVVEYLPVPEKRRAERRAIA